MFLIKPTISQGKAKETPSLYNPNKEERDILIGVLEDLEVADNIRNKTYAEFNYNGFDLSLEEYIKAMRMRFNNTPPPRSEDPDESWRANVVRPLTRNKIMATVANLTASIFKPVIIAQNDESQEDKEMATVMDDAVEFVNEQVGYEEKFLMAVQELCVNPGTIVYQGYSEVKRKVKTITENGWIEEEIDDEDYNGFQMEVIPTEEIYLGNFYEPYLQKQPFIFWRRIITYDEALRKYGKENNFKYVTAGLKTFYVSEEDTFFEKEDDDLDDRLVEELVYLNKSADLELVILNGILVSEPDRPMQRKDKRYPFVMRGYERYNAKFAYYMPLAAKMAGDQDVVDVAYNMTIDGSFLQMFPPTAVYGVETVEGSIIAPGKVTSFANPASKAEPISVGNSVNAGFNLMQKIEASASESSVNAMQGGQSLEGQQTKFEIQQIEANAQTVLSLAGKFIGYLVAEYAGLLINSIIQFMPIANMMEVSNDEDRLLYPKLFLNKNETRKKSKTIEFTDEMEEATSEEELKKKELLRSRKLLKKEELTEMEIVEVDPKSFRDMKYLVKTQVEPVNKNTRFARKIFAYDRLIQNPLADQKETLKDFLLSEIAPGKEDKYIKEEPPVQQGAPMPAQNGNTSSINNQNLNNI